MKILRLTKKGSNIHAVFFLGSARSTRKCIRYINKMYPDTEEADYLLRRLEDYENGAIDVQHLINSCFKYGKKIPGIYSSQSDSLIQRESDLYPDRHPERKETINPEPKPEDETFNLAVF